MSPLGLKHLSGFPFLSEQSCEIPMGAAALPDMASLLPLTTLPKHTTATVSLHLLFMLLEHSSPT